jgi:hypothetical protein
LWQCEHRTPSARVNPFITGSSREPGQSLGKTCKSFGFSGQVHFSCAQAGRLPSPATITMIKTPGQVLCVMSFAS